MSLPVKPLKLFYTSGFELMRRDDNYCVVSKFKVRILRVQIKIKEAGSEVPTILCRYEGGGNAPSTFSQL